MVALGSKGTAVVTTPSDTQILITREFAAPRHAVFRVLTEPELIKRWWSGGFGEVVPSERIVCTEVYEGAPDESAPAICTYDLTEENGRTTLSLLTEMASKEDRDALLASGMEAGVQAGYDLLEEIAISIR